MTTAQTEYMPIYLRTFFSSTVQLGAPIRVVFRVMLVGSDMRRCGYGISASEAHPPSEL
jgi:hypothetical protein